MLLNQTWVCSPVCSKASLLTPGRGEESATLITGHQERRTGSSCSKFPIGFQGGGLKGWYEGGGCRVWDQLVHNPQIGWHQGEVSSIISLLVSTSQGSMFLWSSLFIWKGSASCKNSLRICVRPLVICFNR